jgi:magnesium transporter
MFFLSQVLNTPLEDQQHERVGKLIDVLLPVTQSQETSAIYPDALLVEGEDGDLWRLPIHAVERLENTLHLLIPRVQLATYTEAEQDIRLVRDVQDKQVVNFKRKKAMRVSDIGFADDWQILGIDTSMLGLVRRLAPAWLFGQPQDSAVRSKLVPWREIELINARPGRSRGSLYHSGIAARLQWSPGRTASRRHRRNCAPAQRYPGSAPDRAAG